jgi:Magnesium chelatase, subunit ChlI
MLARRLTAILVDLTPAEAIETTRIPCVAGLTGDCTALVTTRPFRAPHHTISAVGLIGGGQVPQPGEVSLAHNGVLFWMNCPSAAAMSWRSCASPSRSVSQEYNLPRVIDLNAFAGLAIRVMAGSDSSEAR